MSYAFINIYINFYYKPHNVKLVIVLIIKEGVLRMIPEEFHFNIV